MIATDFTSSERTLWIRVRYFVQKPWPENLRRGHFEPVSMKRESFDNNFLAFPEERVQEIRHRIAAKGVPACQSFE